MEASRGFAPEGDLRPVDAVDPRSAPGGPERRCDAASREEAKLHEPLGDVRGEVDPVEDRFFPLPEVEERGGVSCVRHVRDRRELKPDLSRGIRMLSSRRHVKALSRGRRTGPATREGVYLWAAGAAGAFAAPMSRSSTSKMRVAPGLIFGGEPASP